VSPRVLVAGAGVSGLVAARALAGRADVVIAEAADRLGGKIATDLFRNRPLDLGPDAFITRDRAATDLCRELGLTDELLAPASSHAAVFAHGDLHRLPTGLVIGIPTDLAALAHSGLVSRRGIRRARRDRYLPGVLHLDGDNDPSVADALGRLGPEVLDHLVDPLIGGINASDIGALSLRASLPQLVERLDGQRSVMAALRPLATRSASDGPIFYGLAHGLETLIGALAASAVADGATVCTKTTLEHLEVPATPDAPWRATLNGSVEEFDAVVLALPAHVLSPLLSETAPALSHELAQIPYAGVATVTVAFEADAVPPQLARRLGEEHRPGLAGNGVLIARERDRLCTAVTFTSTKWPRSANPGEVVLRASVGRHGDEQALRLNDETLRQRVLDELGAVTGIRATPLEARIIRYPASFPQYVTGHLARVDRIEAEVDKLPRLALCGAAYRGIGIPACVRSGQRAVETLGSLD
jgi:protoporphyrinogen/coproporphyrinogen III oxidase